jgi:transcriptional regulator with XRE-family HTH domain
MTRMETATGLGKLLRDARLRRGLTQEQVGDALGVEKSEVSAFEVGRRKWPQQHIAGLARVLGLSQTEMAVAAGLIDKPETLPPRPVYQDDRLEALAENWDQLTDVEVALLMVVLDRNLMKRGLEGVDNLVRSVGRSGDISEASG